MGAQTASTGSKVGAAHLNYALCEVQRSFGLTVPPTYLLFLNLYQDHRLLRCDVMQSGTQRDDVTSCCYHATSYSYTHIVESTFYCEFFGFGSGRD
jgi:hypothetical protein